MIFPNLDNGEELSPRKGLKKNVQRCERFEDLMSNVESDIGILRVCKKKVEAGTGIKMLSNASRTAISFRSPFLSSSYILFVFALFLRYSRLNLSQSKAQRDPCGESLQELVEKLGACVGTSIDFSPGSR